MTMLPYTNDQVANILLLISSFETILVEYLHWD